MPPRAKVTKKGNAESGKRYPLNMRTTFEMRRSLEEAARRSGRSLAQEAEFRLENSFRSQNQNILDVLIRVATIEPKWIDDGSHRLFMAKHKELMRLTILDFINSLPEPPPNAQRVSDMSPEEYADFVRKTNEQTVQQKKESSK